jgi:ABC-type branched-subunit amino acid transport system ATPase component
MVRGLIEAGHTVLIVEHNIDVVMTICDYIFVLDQGTKFAEGTPGEIYNNEEVLHKYLGE